MDELLRFVNLRPPQAVHSSRGVSLGSKGSRFQGQLSEIAKRAADGGAGSGRPPMQGFADAAAQALAARPREFSLDLSTLPIAVGLEGIWDALTAPGATPTVADVTVAVANQFGGKTPAALTADQGFKDARQNVCDTILLIFVLPPNEGPLPELSRLLLVIDLVERVVADDVALRQPGAIADALSLTLLLPPDIFLSSPTPVRPAGWGDLLIVKEHIKGYEAGEISYIENVLRSESFSRTTKHILTSETTQVQETETTTVTTKDLESTERFELRQEVANSQKESFDFKTGVKVTGDFGEVKLDAHTDVALSSARESSTKTSSDYAKNLVSKAVTSVTERVRQQLTRKVTETFEDDTSHGFDNTRGTTNSVGVYQWVNKVYEAQIFNYGYRLMFDTVVPEPAAYLRSLRARAVLPAPTPVPEIDFTVDMIQPTDIPANPSYYGALLKKFDVTADIAPPPLLPRLFSTSVATKDVEPNAGFLDLADGYSVSTIRVSGWFNWGDGNHELDGGPIVFVGGHVFDLSNRKLDLDNRDPADPTRFEKTAVGAGDIRVPPGAPGAGPRPYSSAPKLAYSISNRHEIINYNVTIEAVCEPTVEALTEWKQKVFAAILQARQNLVASYDDAVQKAAYQQQGQTDGQIGTNPDTNRLTERMELKKAVGSMLLPAGDLITFGAVDDAAPLPAPPPPAPPQLPATFLPKVDQALAEGRRIKFFEEAFEWENMTYIFYPYFWGREATWEKSALLDDPDPLFAGFLRAGAARVVVPVRPSFELDVLYYLRTGVLWLGRDLVHIGDADYLPLADEMRAAEGGIGNEVPVGDPWTYRLPTELVFLRETPDLPNWTRTDDPHRTAPGDWTWQPTGAA